MMLLDVLCSNNVESRIDIAAFFHFFWLGLRRFMKSIPYEEYSFARLIGLSNGCRKMLTTGQN